jgi:rRNA maturation endonuclease Nob1
MGGDGEGRKYFHIRREVKVTVRCIQCKKKKEVNPYNVVGVPICEDCGMPMIVTKATRRNT